MQNATAAAAATATEIAASHRIPKQPKGRGKRALKVGKANLHPTVGDSQLHSS